MGESLDRDGLVAALGRILDRLEAGAEELGRLDAAMGDGDLGITMTLGCRAVRKALPELASQDIGAIVARSGTAFNTAASSTMGALLAIGALRAGKEGKGAISLDPPLLVRMLRAAETGIQERGKASRGDKTLLDALGPSIDALEGSLSEGNGLADAVAAAAAAARSGVQATISMTARTGRGGWIPERTVGHADPGATAIMMMWEGLASSFGENPSQ